MVRCVCVFIHALQQQGQQHKPGIYTLPHTCCEGEERALLYGEEGAELLHGEEGVQLPHEAEDDRHRHQNLLQSPRIQRIGPSQNKMDAIYDGES